MTACNDDESVRPKTDNFRVSTEMLMLKNDSTAIAGTVEVFSDLSEVELEWLTSPVCKLNTQLSKLYLENGKAVLPVEWLKPFEEEEALSAISFNTGVKIKAGNETKYVSLVWGEKEDKSFQERLQAASRSVLADTRESKVLVSPNLVRMNYQTGGAVIVTLENVASAIVDYSSIKQSMNIDLTSLPVTLTGSQILLFKWKGSAPTTSFTAGVTIYGVGVPATTFEILYDASDNPGTDPGPGPDPEPGSDLKASSIVPAGNIPDEGGTYFCNFTGTYTGQVIYRALKNGVEIARTTGTAPSLLSVNVPGITGATEAAISFEYSKDGNTWFLIERRTQAQENLAVYPIEPGGNIPAAGGTYTCSVYGTYSKKITVHARFNDLVLASSSGSVPSKISLQIPAYLGVSSRLIIFEYSKNGGPWLTMEVKRQLGR